MQIVAYQKNIRTSPRKLRLVADSVRSLHPSKALIQLKFMPKRASRTLYKVINQAVRNAVNNQKLKEQDLSTQHILVEEGPRYKRFRAASRGRARLILKRTCHIKVILEGKENTVMTKSQADEDKKPKAEPKNIIKKISAGAKTRLTGKKKI